MKMSYNPRAVNVPSCKHAAMFCCVGLCVQELLEAEPDAKWPLLTLTRLKELQQQVQAGSTSASSADAAATSPAAAAAAAAGSGEGLAAQVAAGYARLIELDPLRRGYYQDAVEGRAHVVARPAAAAAAAPPAAAVTM
jgi:geranylgeranyl transferase type-2 subunit alpha